MMPIDYHHNNHLDQGPGQCSQCVTVINVRSSPGHTLQVSSSSYHDHNDQNHTLQVSFSSSHDHNDQNRDDDNDLEDDDDDLEETPNLD